MRRREATPHVFASGTALQSVSISARVISHCLTAAYIKHIHWLWLCSLAGRDESTAVCNEKQGSVGVTSHTFEGDVGRSRDRHGAVVRVRADVRDIRVRRGPALSEDGSRSRAG